MTLSPLETIVNVKSIPRDRLTLVESKYESIPQLPIGQVGTILEVYPGKPPLYLVEFADLQGREYAMVVLQANEIIPLHYELSLAS
ncbi:MAG: DUF4926 domain-containing protein [Synechocystis sp.]|nr:DUF4926 domain-containing protein [Synechocystis sp.]